MTECNGTWQDRHVAGSDVLECDDCGEIMVLIRGRAFTYPAGFGLLAARALAEEEALLPR